MSNSYTAELIEQIVKTNNISSNSFIREIAAITKQNNIIDMVATCQFSSKQSSLELKKSLEEPQIKHLKRLLEDLPNTILEVTKELKAFGDPVKIVIERKNKGYKRN
jgi:hypothetical protein